MLFEEINLSENQYPKLISACNGTEYFLASLIPIFIVERVGRRKLMLGGVSDVHEFIVHEGANAATLTGSGDVTFDGLPCNHLLGSEEWTFLCGTCSSCVPVRFQHILRFGMAGNDLVVPGGNCASAYSCSMQCIVHKVRGDPLSFNSPSERRQLIHSQR